MSLPHPSSATGHYRDDMASRAQSLGTAFTVSSPGRMHRAGQPQAYEGVGLA